MDNLGKEIARLIIEANPKIKKVVGVYGGRFQPFGPHHYKTYKWLANQVDVAYITTSNIKKPPRHPMNFREKVRHMSKMGVSKSKIVEERTPYVANNVMKKFNKDTTAVVYIFGKKDAGRLQGGKKKSGGLTYYQDYKKNRNNLKGYEEHGYILTAPHVTISIGGQEVSGTSMRTLLGSPKINDDDRAKLFKKMFGYFDKGVFQMMTNKFKKLFNETSGTGNISAPPAVVFKPVKKMKKLKKKWDDDEGMELLRGQMKEISVKNALKKLKIPIKFTSNKQKLVNYFATNPQVLTQFLRLIGEEQVNEDWFKKGSKKDRALKLKISKLYSKAFKMVSNSKEQLKVRKEIEKLRNQLSEDVKLPINIGDTIKMGRFKNKKVTIKSIDWNEKGDLLINGRTALKFRIVKEIVTRNLKKYIKESSLTQSSGGALPADDGPSYAYGNFTSYKKRNINIAGRLGFDIVDYIIPNRHKRSKDYREYPDGPVKAVSYAPAGDGTGKTPNNQIDLKGGAIWTAYKKHIKPVATQVGYEVLDFLSGLDKEQLKQVKSDSSKTLKQGEKENPTDTKKKRKGEQHKDMEVVKEMYSVDWWKDILLEVACQPGQNPERDGCTASSGKSSSKNDPPSNTKDKRLPGIDKKPSPNSLKAKGATTKGPKTDDDAVGSDAEKERAIIRGIEQLVHKDRDIDLCKVSVPGTNLFCDGNKGIPRKEMPQLKSKPKSGSKAEELVKQGKLKLDKNGEVNTEELFLTKLGKESVNTKVKVTSLKATQNQLVGKKVSLFLNQLQNGDPDSEFTKALKEPIIVSKDGYIVDGHHRWAALVALDIANGGDGDIEMNVKLVDEPIESLIEKSNKFTEDMGLETKSAGKEKPKQHKTKKGSQVIGVKHGQSTKEIIDGIKKDIKPNEKVTFVAEGGWIEDGKVKGLEGEQKEIVQGLLDHFGDNLEITSMEEGADVYDNESPVYKHIEKKGKLSQSQSKAAIWSNMVGQDKEKSDMSVEDYLDDEGIGWLKGEAKKAKMNFSDDFPNKISKEDYNILYKLNYGPEDKDGTPETQVSRAQGHYNEFRQNTVVNKINKSEKSGRKAIVTPGEDHAEPIANLLNKEKNESLSEVSSNSSGYSADGGEPDTGFIRVGNKRKLGTLKGKPEPWFEKGGYTQTSFPTADDPYGGPEKDDRHYQVKKKVSPDEDYEELIDSDDFLTDETGDNFVQSLEEFSVDWWKELLLEGGAYGHMAHPFDDKDLKFSDLKKIIDLGLGGNLSREDNVTEKLDGQNIMISWKNGKLIAARNKGHIKNAGKTALTTSGIKSKFKGRGDIRNAFVFAMRDLERAIKGLSQKQKDKIFNEGKHFMNMEVMWPKSSNVIDYDKAELVFHGALKYDDSGNVVGEVKGSGRMLQGMIRQINQHIQKKYRIGKPQFLTIPKHQDFGTMKSTFNSQLNKLRNEFGLKDSDTLGMYHQSYWQEYIYNAAQQFGYTIPMKILKKLTKRWAFFDKSYKIPVIKSDLEKQPKFLEWVLSTDKNDHAAMVKRNMKPFEILFFKVGAEIMKNMSGFLAANPDKAVQGVKKKLDAAIKDVEKGDDLKKLNRLKIQMDRLNAIGGTKAIVPSEGIVFKYKGKTYKFTGAFAPINQITGLMSF